MTNEECLDKALEYTGITNNCCNKVDRCIYSDRCYLHGEVSECEEYTVFKRIKSALEREPVRHGEWIGYPECLQYENALTDEDYACSCCGEVFNCIDNDMERFDYCPHCGADMRGES